MTGIIAPIGWGFIPGYPIAGMTAEDLPELPMLRFMERDQRNAAILAMLRENPGLTNVIRPADLQKKYAIPQSTASTLLMAAPGKPPRSVACAILRGDRDHLLNIPKPWWQRLFRKSA